MMTQEENLEISHREANNSVCAKIYDSKNNSDSNLMNGIRNNTLDVIMKNSDNISDIKLNAVAIETRKTVDESGVVEVITNNSDKNISNMNLVNNHETSTGNLLQIQINLDKTKKQDQIVYNKSENETKNKANELNNRICEINPENEDPMARINKLRANIANTLKEVKAVLIQHGEQPSASTDPVSIACETSDIQPEEDKVIRFRFVKRIRKRSQIDLEENDTPSLEINKEQKELNKDKIQCEINVPSINTGKQENLKESSSCNKEKDSKIHEKPTATESTTNKQNSNKLSDIQNHTKSSMQELPNLRQTSENEEKISQIKNIKRVEKLPKKIQEKLVKEIVKTKDVQEITKGVVKKPLKSLSGKKEKSDVKQIANYSETKNCIKVVVPKSKKIGQQKSNDSKSNISASKSDVLTNKKLNINIKKPTTTNAYKKDAKKLPTQKSVPNINEKMLLDTFKGSLPSPNISLKSNQVTIIDNMEKSCSTGPLKTTKEKLEIELENTKKDTAKVLISQSSVKNKAEPKDLELKQVLNDKIKIDTSKGQSIEPVKTSKEPLKITTEKLETGLENIKKDTAKVLIDQSPMKSKVESKNLESKQLLNDKIRTDTSKGQSIEPVKTSKEPLKITTEKLETGLENIKKDTAKVLIDQSSMKSKVESKNLETKQLLNNKIKTVTSKDQLKVPVKTTKEIRRTSLINEKQNSVNTFKRHSIATVSDKIKVSTNILSKEPITKSMKDATISPVTKPLNRMDKCDSLQKIEQEINKKQQNLKNASSATKTNLENINEPSKIVRVNNENTSVGGQAMVHKVSLNQISNNEMNKEIKTEECVLKTNIQNNISKSSSSIQVIPDNLKKSVVQQKIIKPIDSTVSNEPTNKIQIDPKGRNVLENEKKIIPTEMPVQHIKSKIIDNKIIETPTNVIEKKSQMNALTKALAILSGTDKQILSNVEIKPIPQKENIDSKVNIPIKTDVPIQPSTSKTSDILSTLENKNDNRMIELSSNNLDKKRFKSENSSNLKEISCQQQSSDEKFITQQIMKPSQIENRMMKTSKTLNEIEKTIKSPQDKILKNTENNSILPEGKLEKLFNKIDVEKKIQSNIFVDKPTNNSQTTQIVKDSSELVRFQGNSENKTTLAIESSSNVASTVVHCNDSKVDKILKIQNQNEQQETGSWYQSTIGQQKTDLSGDSVQTIYNTESDEKLLNMRSKNYNLQSKLISDNSVNKTKSIQTNGALTTASLLALLPAALGLGSSVLKSESDNIKENENHDENVSDQKINKHSEAFKLTNTIQNTKVSSELQENLTEINSTVKVKSDVINPVITPTPEIHIPAKISDSETAKEDNLKISTGELPDGTDLKESITILKPDLKEDSAKSKETVSETGTIEKSFNQIPTISDEHDDKSDNEGEIKSNEITIPEEKGEKSDTTTKKRKMKKKVVIRRIKRRLSKDNSVDEKTIIEEPEICEKEIEPKVDDDKSEDIPTLERPPERRSCLKICSYEPGDLVMYADRIRKIVKWKKATVIDRITSISYTLDIEGDEKPAHISYIKKYTDKKVKFGGKEYLEIDYAQDDESDGDDEEQDEQVHDIWAEYKISLHS